MDHQSHFAEAIAQHFHDVHFGGNWTDVSLINVLDGITLDSAKKQIGNSNSIALLLYHMMFYNRVVFDGTFGEKKHFEHEESFQATIETEQDWQKLQVDYFAFVEKMHEHILNLSDEQLLLKKPGNHSTNYKNLHGLIEHIHYHLGQISLLKKLLNEAI